MTTTPLLDTIDYPQDLRRLREDQLPQLAAELRTFLLESISQQSGRGGAGRGIALCVRHAQ